MQGNGGQESARPAVIAVVKREIQLKMQKEEGREGRVERFIQRADEGDCGQGAVD